MKIAIWHNLPSGGGKRALYEHVRGLLGKGHQLEAWCPPTADLSYLPLADLIPEHVVPLDQPKLTDWEHRLRIPGPIGPHLASMERHCRMCVDEINAAGFDILFAQSCQFYAVAPIGRLISIPKVLYLQEPRRPLYEPWPRLPWLAREPSQSPLLSLHRLREVALDRRTIRNVRLAGREERRNAAAYDLVLVNSMFSREMILRCYGIDSEVCYLGTDVTRFVDRGLPRKDIL